MSTELTEYNENSDPILAWLAGQPAPKRDESPWEKACRLMDAFCEKRFNFQLDSEHHLEGEHTTHAVAHYTQQDALDALSAADFDKDSLETTHEYILEKNGLPAGFPDLDIDTYEKQRLVDTLHQKDNNLIALALKDGEQAGMNRLYKIVCEGFESLGTDTTYNTIHGNLRFGQKQGDLHLLDWAILLRQPTEEVVHLWNLTPEYIADSAAINDFDFKLQRSLHLLLATRQTGFFIKLITRSIQDGIYWRQAVGHSNLHVCDLEETATIFYRLEGAAKALNKIMAEQIARSIQRKNPDALKDLVDLKHTYLTMTISCEWLNGTASSLTKKIMEQNGDFNAVKNHNAIRAAAEYLIKAKGSYSSAIKLAATSSRIEHGLLALYGLHHIKKADNNGNTALHHVAAQSQENIERLCALIDAFPWLLDEVNHRGETPLITAAISGNHDALELLYETETGFDFSFTGFREYIFDTCSTSRGSLQMLIIHGDTNTLRSLLKTLQKECKEAIDLGKEKFTAFEHSVRLDECLKTCVRADNLEALKIFLDILEASAPYKLQSKYHQLYYNISRTEEARINHVEEKESPKAEHRCKSYLLELIQKKPVSLPKAFTSAPQPSPLTPTTRHKANTATDQMFTPMM